MESPAPAVTRFARLAEEYVAFIDAADGCSPESVLREAHWRIADLYAAALRLPDVATDPADDEAREDTPEDEPFNEALRNRARRREAADMTTEEWMAWWRRLRAHLGPDGKYRELFNPYESPDEEPVVGDLADDFLDVYRDLRRGLVQWRAGHEEDAAWDWQFNFRQHWGDHASSALRALYALVADYRVNWPSLSGEV